MDKDIKQRIFEIETILESIQAEEVVLEKLTREVADRVERKTTTKNFIAILIMILSSVIGSIGSINIAIPQLRKDLQSDLSSEVDSQVENVEDKVEKGLEQVERRTTEEVLKIKQEVEKVVRDENIKRNQSEQLAE